MERIVGRFFFVTCLSFTAFLWSQEIEVIVEEEEQPVVVEQETPTPSKVVIEKEESQKTLQQEEKVETEKQEESSEETPSESAQQAKPTPTPQVVQGSIRMRSVYEAGIKAYQSKDYAKAVRFLEKAVQMEDPHTPFWYYAEAHAMLGVIYQFYYKVPQHRRKAYEHYRQALEIDPATKTARKYIHRVAP